MTARAVTVVAAALLAGTALLGAAPTAAAADPSANPTPAATAGPAGQLAADASQSERLAAELRKNPVYVSADLPRTLPRSLAPDIAALAARTGVRTYVLALPEGDEALLALVHDRLGENGVYVLIGDYGRITAAGFGTDAPVDDARRYASYRTPYGAGPLDEFRAFAETLAEGKEQAAAKAESAYDSYHDGGRPDLYIDSTDRQNQNLLLGLAVVVIPGLVLALGLRLASRRGRPAAPPRNAPGRRPAVVLKKRPQNRPSQNKPSPGKQSQNGQKARAARPARRPGVLPVTLVATVAAVLGVVFAAPTVFPQTVDSVRLDVTQGDLDARVEEAAAALAAGPIYQDPSGPTVLTGADLTAVQGRLAAIKTPVYLLATPSLSEDESERDSEILLSRVHARTGRAGVYVQIDPLQGYLYLEAFGTGTDVERRFHRLSTDVAYPDRSGDSDDLQIPSRLNRALDAVAAAEPTAGASGENGETELPPVRDNRLPALFSNDFGPGIAIGFLLLGLVLLLAWGVLAAVRATVHARRARRAAPDRSAPPSDTAVWPSATRPTVRQLRGWATEDLRALTVRLGAADQDAPGRTRAWDCLDAAQLLLGDSEGRAARVEPGDLAAAVVLARAGIDALRGRPHPQLCRLDPLHGGATGGRVPAWFATVGIGPRSAQLCPACREGLRRSPAGRGTADRVVREHETAGRLLHLPTADGRAPAVWSEAGDVLPAALEGLDPLILRARESASVQ
ncbi:hypothetical protein [Streptomyces sp. TLI_171]|uniref:hypothetical protein n=1 Tax=Streptomyces sp. TLI_171 TaxID=1938859 RepID=UPI000C182F0C|nr:hypothetical protein [Streptomyces sp. TLI_171]